MTSLRRVIDARLATASTRCFYCAMPLSSRHEQDHFPIPKSEGGDGTVSACINCHDLKDRTPFEDRDTEMIFEAFDGITTPIARIALAKVMALGYRMSADLRQAA